MGSLSHKIRKYLRTKPYPYQQEGIHFLEKCDGRGLICDDMGLGKSLMSLAWAAIHPTRRPVIVICPATIKYNWAREWKTHAGIKVYVCGERLRTEDQDQASLQNSIERFRNSDIYTKMAGLQKARRIREIKLRIKRRKERHRDKLRTLRGHNVYICNYDVLDAWLPVLKRLGAKVLIIDECSHIKNMKAKRTKACKQLSVNIPHKIALSGTPITGKPIEFWLVLNLIWPDEFESWWKFAFQYCNPKKNRFSGGWDFTGTSRLDALHRVLKHKMVRRMKADVLPDLPTKTRTIIPLEISNRREYKDAEANFLSWLLRRKGREAMTRAERAEVLVRFLNLKILAAQGKLRMAFQWIREWLEETDQKLLVFAIHKPIIKALRRTFPSALVVDGSVSAATIHRNGVETSKRQEVVDRFQSDPKARLFLGQLKAAGQGLNLTAASNVLFLELGWGPGEHDQAEDRSLRIGQTKNVSVYYLVGRRTVEERILEILHTKDETVARILDGRKGGVMRLLEMFMRAESARPTFHTKRVIRG